MIFISHKLWLLSSAFLRLLFQSAQLPFPTATCFLHFSIAPCSLALSTRDLFSRAFHRIHITLPIRLLHVFARVSPTTFYGWHAYRHLSAKIIFPLFLLCFLLGSLSSNLYREWFCLWRWRTYSWCFQASLETVPSFRGQIAVKLGTWGWLRCCVLPFLIVLFVIKLGVEGALPLNLRKDWPAESYIQDILSLKTQWVKNRKMVRARSKYWRFGFRGDWGALHFGKKKFLLVRSSWRERKSTFGKQAVKREAR